MAKLLKMQDNNNLRIALVHDFLTAYGGAERVLEVFCEMFPEAPIYTLLHDSEKMRGKFSDRMIHTSFLQKFPKFWRRRQKYLLPFMSVAPETFDLREYDLIISSSGAWTKGIITRLDTIHISYIHSPMRFAWDMNGEYLKQQKRCFCVNFVVQRMLNYIRIWDKMAADRPDYLVANSKYTQERIRKYYGRESVVMYPPVVHKEEGRRKKEEGRIEYEIPYTKYFLIVSRLSPYKKIDAAIEAFNKLELPLIIVGEGSQEKHLRSIAGKNVKFLGWQSDEKVGEIYENARAFIFPVVDDFGLAPAEAMTHGVPLISIRRGGVLEINEEGKTGEFFDADAPEIIADAVRRFVEKEEGYDREYIKQKAERFGKERFKREIDGLVRGVANNFQ